MPTQLVATKETKISCTWTAVSRNFKENFWIQFSLLPGISLAKVGTRPRNIPFNPSFFIISLVITQGPTDLTCNNVFSLYLVTEASKRVMQTLDFPLPKPCVSWCACNLHLTNSVGHKVREEKNAAKKPADALAKGLRSCTFCNDITSKLNSQDEFFCNYMLLQVYQWPKQQLFGKPHIQQRELSFLQYWLPKLVLFLHKDL